MTAGARVWVITGASSGFGAALARNALAAGDVVVATARGVDRLEELRASAPDRVDARALDLAGLGFADAERFIGDVVARHGRIDVLVNNAGRTQVGALEETTEDEFRQLFDLHVVAPAALTRAALPHLRRQGTGTVVQMSSVGGQVVAPGFGVYCATKFALEGLTETLAAEVPGDGIRFLIVEPGAFRTGLFDRSAAIVSAESPAYAATVGPTREYVATGGGTQPGDPDRAAAAIRAAVLSDDPPLRLVLGGDAWDGIAGRLATLDAELRAHEATARATAFDDAVGGAA